MTWKERHIGKTEVAFSVAVVILVGSAVASLVFGRDLDPGLTTAAAGVVGTVLVARTEMKPRGDDDDESV